MKYIYIKGVHFENKGAELMLQTLVQKLEKENDVKIVLAPSKASPFSKRCELGAFQFFSLSFGALNFNRLLYFVPKKIRQWLTLSYGIVTEPDLYAVLDASGYAYGDKWPVRALNRTCSQLARMSQHGGKYIFLPQMLGPFTDPESQTLIKKYLHRASLVFAREETSRECVESVTGPLTNLNVAPDFTNLLSFSDITPNSKKMLVIPNSNMVSSRSGDKDWKGNYLAILSTCIESGLALGLNICILNHEGESDKPLCELLAKEFAGKVSLEQGFNALQIKRAIAESEIVVSSRFHGCVSALSQGVTCIGTSWSHKYEELYNDYSVSPLLISKPNQIPDYAAFFNHAYENRIQTRDNLLAISSQLKLKSKETWEKISACLQDTTHD